MNKFNQMPENSVDITENYNAQRYFHTYCFESTESRQPAYSEKQTDGMFPLRIYWIDKSQNLGFGIADDWKEKTIRWFLIGSQEAWKNFHQKRASQFAGDNS